jgi:hypothetical protein
MNIQSAFSTGLQGYPRAAKVPGSLIDIRV